MNGKAFWTLSLAVLSVLVLIAPIVQPASASVFGDIRDYSRIVIDTSPGGRCRFFTVDPDGNRTGMDPFSERIFKNIPHSGFGDESVEKATPHYLLLINSPVSGVYETHVVGVTEGPFEVDFTLTSRSGRKNKQSFDFQGTIKPGREYIYRIQYSPEVGSVSSVTPATYLFGGFRNSSGKREISVFNRKTPISVSFSLSRWDGKPANDVKARLHVQRISSMKPTGEPFEAISASGQNDGNIFRFDPEKKENTYLMDASDLESGVWKLIVLLDDGSKQTTWIGIE